MHPISAVASVLAFRGGVQLPAVGLKGICEPGPLTRDAVKASFKMSPLLSSFSVLVTFMPPLKMVVMEMLLAGASFNVLGKVCLSFLSQTE